jgi:hypothetical protein
MLLLMIISSWDRDTADEQNATSPPCGVLYALGHFTNFFWSYNVCTEIHQSKIPNLSETYLFVIYCSHFDNRRPVTRGGSPLWLLELRYFRATRLRATEAREKATRERART